MQKTAALAGILLILLLPVISQTQWEPLFYDNFDILQQEYWSLEEGWSHQQLEGNGVLEGLNHSWARCTQGQHWTDYRFLCKLMLQKGACHINFRVSDLGRYFLGIHSEGIYLTRDNLWGTYTPLGDDAIPVSADEWHRVRILINQQAIQVYLDEELRFQVLDEDALPRGTIAFESLEESTVLVDSVVVEGPPQPEPPEGYDWYKTGGPPGGLGYDIRIHPENSSLVYVTDNPSGVNKSFDGGISWVQRNQGIDARLGDSGEDVPIFSLTLDPVHPERIWCGTQNTKGIFRSDNGGESWQRMDQGVTEGPEISFRGFAIHPENSDVVLAAAEIATLYQGITFNKTKGKIYKSTNGGMSWYPVWEGDNLARVVLYNYDHPDTVYCSTGIFDREAYNSDENQGIAGGVGILKSVDGGENWFTVNQGIDNLYTGFLEMHPEDPGILFAASGNHAYTPAPGGIYKTVNGGTAWIKVLSGEVFSAVTISRSDPRVVYAFGETACYRSNDGGVNWNKLQRPGEEAWGPPGIKPGIPISAAVDPYDEQKVFVNNYNGGNFLSRDGGATWINSSNGYTGADIRDILVHPDSPGEVYAFGRNGAFRSVNGGTSWMGITNGSATTEFIGISSVADDFYHFYGITDADLGIIESKDGGETWTHVFSLGEGSFEDQGFHHFSKIVVSPSDPEILYAGMNNILNIGNLEPEGTPSYGIFKSTDGGVNWVRINEGIPEASRMINTIAVHPGSSDVVYAGTLNDGIYKTINGGERWVPVNNGLASSDIRSLAIDPVDPETIYAGSGNGFGIFKSTDGGDMWNDASSGIQLKCPTYLSSFGRVVEGMDMRRAAPVFTGQPYGNETWTKILDLSIDPSHPSHIYAADYGTGIYFSPDGGSSWAQINNGLTLKTTTCITVSRDGSVLYAGTKGAGVFRLALGNKAPAIEYTIPGTTDTLTVHAGDSLDFEVAAYDLNNQDLHYEWNWPGILLEQPQEHQVRVSPGELPPGYYSLTLRLGDGDTAIQTGWTIQVLEAGTTSMESGVEAEYPRIVSIFPNPFDESLQIRYRIPEETDVSVAIFETSGRKVMDLVRLSQAGGTYTIHWNGRSDHMQQVPAGVYICRFLFRSNGSVFLQERKIVYVP